MYPLPIDDDTQGVQTTEFTEEELEQLDRDLEREAQENQFAVSLMNLSRKRKTWKSFNRVNGNLLRAMSWSKNRL